MGLLVARLTVACAFGIIVGIIVGMVGGAALGLHASTDEVAAAALEAGVNDEHLRGAMATTGLGPREYLTAVGELRGTSYPQPPRGIWDRLAACEATGNWRAATGNGYFGGLQQDMTFWRRYGGLSFAARPDLASRDAQITVAERGLAVQGWGAWPVCSRVIGAR